jgi:hypothetical protein
VQCAGKSDRLFDLSGGFRAVHLSSSEDHPCVKFIAEDLNGSNFVACFKMVKYQAVFKNGIHARLLVKLAQYTVIMLWENVEQYFHGARTSNPVDYVRVRLPDIVRRFSESVNIRFSKSCG